MEQIFPGLLSRQRNWLWTAQQPGYVLAKDKKLPITITSSTALGHTKAGILLVLGALGSFPRNKFNLNVKKGKVIPLHAVEAHGGIGGIAPAHT
jgi:hypothetical protein